MVTTSRSAALVPVISLFTTAGRLAIAGFLAGYSGLTRQACEPGLRQYAVWCHARGVALFAARRADIECFARDLEARGRGRATITRRLCTIAGLYKYAVEEELLDHSPAAHVRRPRLDYESHAVGKRPGGRRLDRHGAGRIVRRAARRAGIGKLVGPHTLRHAFITAAQVSGVASAASFGRIRECR